MEHNPVPPFSLRPARFDDPAELEFLFQLYASTRAAEMAALPWTPEQKLSFLQMQFHAQHTFYQEHYGDGTFEIILVGERRAGRLYVHRTQKYLCVVDIALLPEFCNLGIGGTLLRKLMDEAGAAGLTVQIYVEYNNPAQRLYRRLGFVQTSTEGVYHAMAWRAVAVP